MERWLHEIIDIVVWGRSYWWLHKEIDNKAKELGIRHRIYNHDWYWKFKKNWDWENPFPKELDKEIPKILEVIPSGLRKTFEALVTKETKLFGEEGTVKETFQAYITHCFMDRLWDETPPQEREYVERYYVVWILSPRLLYQSGTDVKNWKIEIKRDGEVWEDSPSLEKDYKNLVLFLIREGILERLFTKTGNKTIKRS